MAYIQRVKMSDVVGAITAAVQKIWASDSQQHQQENEALALATATVESNLNPNDQGDYVNGIPTSFGLFQLHRGGELGTLTPTQAFDPYTNASVALVRFQQVEASHPGLLESNPGEVAALAQRPKNPGAYAAKVNADLGKTPIQQTSNPTSVDMSSSNSGPNISGFFTTAGIVILGIVILGVALIAMKKGNA